MNEMDSKVGGDWQLIKVLGSGGFGQVTLWQDLITGQKIAIKKLLENALKDVTVKAKLIERWCNEVEIMKKLNHRNVVSTLEIPAKFNIADPLPILAMEYCSSGDLRQVLNQPENCCGLSESEVLNILKDISSGLAYLHSCKIIHRDIKPDNIVLQENGPNIIYKLIDLGYAKTLDQSSLSSSFVGTVQYIAPELFMGKAYTSSVDYWSFGLVTHEIITGYRPFLPGFDPSDWMKKIQNKNRKIVCVLESNSGDIVFNSKISRANNLSRCFLEDIETWLHLALDWDGQTRGRDLESNRLVIFENLSEIICQKIIKVFSLPTYEVISYRINSQTDISHLREWLKVDTGVEKDDQVLLLPSGKCLIMQGNLLKHFDTANLGVSDVSLYLFNSCSLSMTFDAVQAPVFVAELRDSLKNPLPLRQLKRYCADSVFFLQSQANLSRNLLKAIRVKIINTKQKTLAVEQLYENLEDEWNRIEYYGHFLSFSLKIDLENYIHYRKAGSLKSSSSVQKWIQNAVDVNNKVAKLKNSFSRTKQRQLMLLAKHRCRNLDAHSNNDVAQQTPLDRLVEKGHKLWEYLHTFSKNDSKISFLTSTLIELIDKATKEIENFLNSQILKTLLMKLSEADDNLVKFFSQLTNIYKSTNVLKRIIENTQAERQKEAWSLIESSKVGTVVEPIKKVEYFENKGSSFFNGFLDLKNDQDRFRVISPTTKISGKSENLVFKSLMNTTNSSDLPSTFDSLNASFLPNVGACSVIEDNNNLRYRIQEVQQSCNKMIKEITSLDWDFVLGLEDTEKALSN